MTDRIHGATAELFAELAGAGVRHVVLSPGSRSAPLTLAAAARTDLHCWMQHDERVAGFFALGLAKATRRAVALVCTSGTAAANYLPAVVEANHGLTPLVVCTADRPPELRGWGSGQTIDQVHLYGTNVRWYAELPVAGEVEPGHFGRAAHRAARAAMDPDAPGPVHLNIPFREPFEPHGPVPTAEPALQSVVGAAAARDGEVDQLVAMVERHERGVVIAGPQNIDRAGVAAVAGLAATAGWPVIADPGSQLRSGPHVASTPVVATADQLLRSPGYRAANQPDAVLRVGGSPVSKATRLWLEGAEPAAVALVDPAQRWEEPSSTLTTAFRSPPGALAAGVTERMERPRTGGWLARWQEAEAAADAAIDRRLADAPLLQPAIARAVGPAVACEGGILVASNSMPVRDLDAHLAASTDTLPIVVNRGASGIDGVVSTALGVAAGSDRPVTLVIGDVALLHDLGGIVAGGRLGLDLTIVVPNDGGGGIFSYLPIADRIPAEDFRDLFVAPHHTTFAALAGFAGLSHRTAADLDGFLAALAATTGSGSVDIVEIPIDPELDMAQHREVTQAVTDAIEA